MKQPRKSSRKTERSAGRERSPKSSSRGTSSGSARNRDDKPSFGDRKSGGRSSGRGADDRSFRGIEKPLTDRGAREDRPAGRSNDAPKGRTRYIRDEDRRSGNPRGNRDESTGAGRSRKPFGEERPSRSREDKPFGDRPSRSRDDKPYGDRPSRSRDDKPYGDRPSRSRDDKPYGDRPSRSRDDKPYGDRPSRSRDDKPYGDRPSRSRENKPFGDRPSRSREDKPFGDRPSRSREDKPFGDRPSRSRDDKPFGDRPSRSRDDKPFGDRPSRSRDDKPFGDRPTRSRDDKPYEDRGRSRSGRSEDRPSQGYEGRGYNSEKDHPFERKKPFDPKRKWSEGPSRRPRVRYEDNDLPPVQKEIRLNRFIGMAGICSRREADDLITAGVISVNGEVVTELGMKVKPGDDIRYNGERIRNEKPVYLLLNKPKDYITTSDDPEGRKTVMELVETACEERIYPVGRLDRNTTGLLMFTNDGDLARFLTHPSSRVKKIYAAELDKNFKVADMQKVREGLVLEDGKIEVDEIDYDEDGLDKKKIGIEIHSGKNRIVRRIFEHLGYEVKKLDRVIFAGLTKKDLPRGRWRFLTEAEVNMLKVSTGAGKKKLSKNTRAKKEELD